MIILDRLHRGDMPQMRAVTAFQTEDRLVFSDQAGVDAYLEAYRRADPAASFTQFTVPDISLRDFWEKCRDHDWHYDASDDPRVWREGGSKASTLRVQSTISMKHRRVFIDWRRHKFSGPAYGTAELPAPEEPTEAALVKGEVA